MGMADEAHVAHTHAMAGELVLDHVLVELQAAHAEGFHDLIGAVAGVDDDRIGASGNQKTQRQHTAGTPAVAAKHEETRFQLDVPIVENFDFECHVLPPIPFAYCSPRSVTAR